MQGDPWQQGGAFVLDTAGAIRFTHVSQRAGDHAPPEALLEALRAVTEDRPRPD
jgi:hypothetical protein